MNACIVNEPSSGNDYIIDNQSSYELFYYQYRGENITTINITPASRIVIDDGIVFGKAAQPADDFFYIEALDNRNGADIFLLRDSSGIELQALQLNTRDVLNWEVELINEGRYSNSYEQTLIVTDELID
jgi:hypothetical protein